jgi:hypothetical protein
LQAIFFSVSHIFSLLPTFFDTKTTHVMTHKIDGFPPSHKLHKDPGTSSPENHAFRQRLSPNVRRAVLRVLAELWLFATTKFVSPQKRGPLFETQFAHFQKPGVMNIVKRKNGKGDKIYFTLEWGRGTGEQMSTGVFIYSRRP